MAGASHISCRSGTVLRMATVAALVVVVVAAVVVVEVV